MIRLTQQLIRIRSENPPGDESRIAHFIKIFFEDLGLKPKIYEFKKRRTNIIATLKGANKNYRLLVSPHLDTVPAGGNWKFPPFGAELRRGRIYGRGASDDKGNLAVLLETIRSLVEQRRVLSYDLVFAATADEETGSGLGLIPLLDKGILNPQAALILDADEFKIVVVQKGLIHLKVKIQGKSAHGAYPWKGINAIDLALKVLSEIKSLRFTPLEKAHTVRNKISNGARANSLILKDRPSYSFLRKGLTGFTYKKHSYLRPPTVNIGKIAGGDKVNVVADWCEFELDFRFLPGMSASGIIRELRRIIKKYTKKFTIEVKAMQKPTQIDRRHFLVEYLKKAILAHKIKPRIAGSEGATVITFLQNKNIPAVTTGFSCSGCAHSINEYIKVDYLYKGAKVLEDFLKNFTPLAKRI